MTAHEIVHRVNLGDTIIVSRKQAAVFMQQCERHQIQCDVKMEAKRITWNGRRQAVTYLSKG